MDKKRILFIDDNQGILDGLRRALRPERNGWDMVFVTSVEDARELMSKKGFDAIISDMRMPGVSGVELLDEVASLYPDMVRFILSGHSKKDMTLQSVKSAHQFFPKPCNIDSLKTALTRSFYLREQITNLELRRLVSGIVTLPSHPKIFSEMVEALNSSEPSVEIIGKIISKEPAISAKILQLVNSAFFGLGRQVFSPEEAVTLLGVEVIKQLVLSVELFSQFDQDKQERAGFALEASIDHCIRVGLLAKCIAKSEKADQKIVEESYLAGLLHNVGQYILADCMPEQYKKVVDLRQAGQVDTCTAERKVFGTDHGEVGAYLLGLWGFSDAVLESVAFHHTPEKAGNSKFTPLTAVYVANILEGAVTQGTIASVSERLDMEYLEALGLDGRLQAWKTFCLNGEKSEA